MAKIPSATLHQDRFGIAAVSNGRQVASIERGSRQFNLTY